MELPILPGAPTSTRLVYSKGVTQHPELKSLMHCFTWHWTMHYIQTPACEQCPHDWSMLEASDVFAAGQGICELEHRNDVVSWDTFNDACNEDLDSE